MRRMVLSAALSVLVAGSLFAQSRPDQDAGIVDFARDVQPLFRTHCIDCHGPNEQKNGLRLDRRHDAMKGGTVPVIGVGSSAASRLYLKLVGDEYGPQMPPDGPLTPEEIDIIRRWIDQGAVWPDELDGETPATIADPQAARLMEDLREGDRQAFVGRLRETPDAARLKGPGGSTPLMYAALYSDAEAVRMLLDAGADVNSRNDAGATALMWAVDDVETVRLLIDAGADTNARSDDGRTPLLVAAGRRRAHSVVELLLKHGAEPSVTVPSYRGLVTPLRQAAESGDETVMKLLIEHGANVSECGPLPFLSALGADSPGCVDLLIQASAPAPITLGLAAAGPPFSSADVFRDVDAVEALIRRGADVNARDRTGLTVLMLACSHETSPASVIRALLAQGADVHAKSADGRTALDFARQRGETEIVRLLIEAGTQEPIALQIADALQPAPAASARAAVERSIPLIQRADAGFLQMTGCVSCHHNSLSAMTVGMARRYRLDVDESLAGQQAAKVRSYLDGWRDRVLQGSDVPGAVHTASYLLVGLAAGDQPSDETTDALARYLRGWQLPDGRWQVGGHRPPIASSEFQVTACSLQAMRVFGLKSRAEEYEISERMAVDWLKQAQPHTTEDRAFQILGLHWAGVDEEIVHNAAVDLLAEQRADGGWSPLPSMTSDAYATGQALVALHESGVEPSDPAYHRGVEFLIDTQFEDGSWHVLSRALKFQPHFESGFPHGHDQWISMAATNWATMALIPAAQ